MNRAEAAQRASELYEKLMALPRPTGMSNNEWAQKAGVNTSFFVNVRKGSEPSIGNLRKVLEAVDVSLPEFFADEADGRLVRKPSAQELTAALGQALPEIPKRADRRAAFLADAVLHVLGLPQDLRAKLASQESGGKDDKQIDEQVRPATNAR